MDLFDNDVLGTSNVRITPDFPAVKKSWKSLRTWYIILPIVLMVLVLGFLFIQQDLLYKIADKIAPIYSSLVGGSTADATEADAEDAVEAYTVANVSHAHVDADFNHVCDDCTVKFSNCADADADHYCDVCHARQNQLCSDANRNHYCDVCEGYMTPCIDANKDHKCDYGCNKVLGTHADADQNHKCDYGCAMAIGTHADADKNHKCDYGCAEIFGAHVDEDMNHKCDYPGCLQAIGVCRDLDKNHACDYGCPKTYGEHADSDRDHVCDYGCGVATTECADGNNDLACDICGAPSYQLWQALLMFVPPFIIIEIICLIIWFAKKRRLDRISIEFYSDIIVYKDGKDMLMRTFHGSYTASVRQDTRRERRGNYGTVTIYCPGGPAMSMVFTRIRDPHGLVAQLRAMKPKESIGIATSAPEAK